MKKLVLLAALALSSLMACSSCVTHNQTGSSPPSVDNQITCNEAGCPIKLPEAGSVNDVISEDNWQFTLSGSGWTPVKSPDDTIKVIFTNKDNGTIVFFVKDPTQETSAEYIINALRSFKAADTSILSAKQVIINGTNFVMVTAQGESRKIWTWISVQKGFGYVFTCAVDNRDAGAADVLRCQDIVDTLQIK
jgi:hypothetical protein